MSLIEDYKNEASGPLPAPPLLRELWLSPVKNRPVKIFHFIENEVCNSVLLKPSKFMFNTNIIDFLLQHFYLSMSVDLCQAKSSDTAQFTPQRSAKQG